MNNDIVLIDLSSIAYPIWHMSQSDPNPNAASTAIVARIRALADGHPKVAICCDAGRSFRHEVAPSYKANRPERDDALQHQITLAREQLERDGFPVWAVKGYEADDLIASATRKALETADVTVLIVSADKDLLQLVGPRVRAKSVRDGSIVDAEAVGQKFGVRPDQMRDYLTLVGDTADNIKGAKGIGPKKAGELLAKFGTLDRVYEDLETIGAAGMGLPPAVAQSLRDFKAGGLTETRGLVLLQDEVAIPFEQLFGERVALEAATFAPMDDLEDDQAAEQQEPAAAQLVETPAAITFGRSTIEDRDQPTSSEAEKAAPSTALVRREPDEVLPAPTQWERGLDPRSMRDARILAKDMHDSRMFNAYGAPQAVLSTIMVGRELGLPAMASLRSVHVIEGRHSLSAQLMVAVVLKSGLAEYWTPVSFSDTEATFETKRKGAPQPIRLTHTIEMARKAWKKDAGAWEKSGWGANPTDMLVARASARLARMVYPDVIGGLYTPEELREIRDQDQAA